jgi:hypothetical protein
VHKVATAVTLAVGLLLASLTPALADVDPIKGDTGAGISVSVSSVKPGSGGAGGRPCTYQQANVPGDPSTELVVTPDMVGQRRGTPNGTWYFYQCPDPQAPLGVRTGVIFVPTAQPAVPPAVLAQQASKFVPAPPPGIQTSPPATVDQVVNVPTWLWVDPATWGSRSATASVPNESATVTATPVSVTWTMGDGTKVVCRGPGTPYTARTDPARPSPTCGHTYRRSSARQAGLRYPVAATTTWALRWTATGAVTTSGTLAPLLRTSTVSLRVAEAQTVNS